MKHNTIGLMLPTRGRPALLARFVKSVAQTADDLGRIEIHTYIDQDDPELENYLATVDELQEFYRPLGLSFHGGVGEPIGVTHAANQLGLTSRTDLLVASNDDQIYVTRGWDTCLDREVAKFPDGIFLFWFNDSLESDIWCCFPIVERRWLEALNYYVPTQFEHFFADIWLFDIALRIGRAHYLRDIEMKHIAAWAGLAPVDETARRTRGPLSAVRFARDAKTFQCLERYRELDAGLLRTLLVPSSYEIKDGHAVGTPRSRTTRDPVTGVVHFHMDLEAVLNGYSMSSAHGM